MKEKNKENNQFSSGKNRPKLDHQVCDIHLRSDQADSSENRPWLLIVEVDPYSRRLVSSEVVAGDAKATI